MVEEHELAPARPSVVREPDFVKLWVGETISLLGTQVTVLALPLVAVITLHATAGQVGVLNACRFAPFMLVTLLAGVVVDLAYQAYLPSLVDRGLLMSANGHLQASESAAERGRPGLGGLLDKGQT